MHSVIENLSARQNKQYPFKDGRKIALVLFGGLMTGVRGAGAMTALHDLGLSQSFDEIFSISAGFCNASYMLSNQPRLGSSIYYEDLTGKEFIHPLKVWNMVDTDVVADIIQNRKSIDVNQIYQTKSKFFVAVENVDKKKMDYLELHKIPKSKYFDLLKAAISIPYLHPGSIKIGRYHYKDLRCTHECVENHLNHVIQTKATDILVIYNTHKQAKYPAVLSEKIYEIVIPSNRKLKRLEKTKDILVAEWQWMYDRTRAIFSHLKTNKIKKEKIAQA